MTKFPCICITPFHKRKRIKKITRLVVDAVNVRSDRKNPRVYKKLWKYKKIKSVIQIYIKLIIKVSSEFGPTIIDIPSFLRS